MSQDTPYIEMAVDKNQEYYVMPSFKSVTESDENDDEDNDDDNGVGGGGDGDGGGGGGGGRGGGGGNNDDDHSPKVVGNLPNTTEPRYKTMFEY